MTVPLVKFLTLHCIVCVLLPTSADNVTLLTFAAERRAAAAPRLRSYRSIYPDGPIAANPPTRHGTDTRTDTVPLHRPCRIPCP